jgi:hypothetical protein
LECGGKRSARFGSELRQDAGKSKAPLFSAHSKFVVRRKHYEFSETEFTSGSHEVTIPTQPGALHVVVLGWMFSRTQDCDNTRSDSQQFCTEGDNWAALHHNSR